MLESPRHGVAIRPPPPPRGGDDDGVDRISGLNDDLLIQVLVRLRCAGAAVRTSVLSRRWHGLWRHLPELSFRGIAPDALEPLSPSLPKLFLLDIDVPNLHTCSAKGVASLLRTAAHLDPVELSIVIAWTYPRDYKIAIEVPSFARATSIRLDVGRHRLASPAQGGEFPVLERLSLASDRLDTGALISRCPKLRVLELHHNCWRLDSITAHSTTLEELVVSDGSVRGVDIVPPVLKKFTLTTTVHTDFSMSLLAPMVENQSWFCSIIRGYPYVGFGGMWSLNCLRLGTEESRYVLGLDIGRSFSVPQVRNLQEMFQFPNLIALELHLETRGHAYGPMVLNLLMIYNSIQRLKLVIERDTRKDEKCLPNCPGDQPQNWRSQNIYLTGLEEVEIENFKGNVHEVCFLKLLFRGAPLVKVTIKLAFKVAPSSRGCKDIYNVFKANPAVECHVYREHGEEVIYA